jgi:hypothetical protein
VGQRATATQSIRPRATTRLEAETRDYWDACDALRLGRPNARAYGTRAAMPRPDAVHRLAELATGRGSRRLRLAAADRLTSMVPAAAAFVVDDAMPRRS